MFVALSAECNVLTTSFGYYNFKIAVIVKICFGQYSEIWEYSAKEIGIINQSGVMWQGFGIWPPQHLFGTSHTPQHTSHATHVIPNALVWPWMKVKSTPLSQLQYYAVEYLETNWEVEFITYANLLLQTQLTYW